jgi:hypothetical protein
MGQDGSLRASLSSPQLAQVFDGGIAVHQSQAGRLLWLGSLCLERLGDLEQLEGRGKLRGAPPTPPVLSDFAQVVYRPNGV